MTSLQYCVILLSLDYKVHYHQIIGQSLVMPHSIAEDKRCYITKFLFIAFCWWQIFSFQLQMTAEIFTVLELCGDYCSPRNAKVFMHLYLQHCSGVLHLCLSWTLYTCHGDKR